MRVKSVGANMAPRCKSEHGMDGLQDKLRKCDRLFTSVPLQATISRIHRRARGNDRAHPREHAHIPRVRVDEWTTSNGPLRRDERRRVSLALVVAAFALLPLPSTRRPRPRRRRQRRRRGRRGTHCDSHSTKFHGGRRNAHSRAGARVRTEVDASRDWRSRACSPIGSRGALLLARHLAPPVNRRRLPRRRRRRRLNRASRCSAGGSPDAYTRAYPGDAPEPRA